MKNSNVFKTIAKTLLKSVGIASIAIIVYKIISHKNDVTELVESYDDYNEFDEIYNDEIDD